MEALFEGVKAGAAGLAEGMANTLFSEGAQKLGMQGASELAALIYNENAFSPYGPGQWPVSMEQQAPAMESAQMEMTPIEPPQIEMGGMEM